MRSEQEIIRGCQKGNKACQYDLVKQYSGMLMTVCRRYVHDEASAKDVLQNSLIKIFKNIKNYQDTGSFEAWMRKITLRSALDWIGKKCFKVESSVNEMPDDSGFEPEIMSRLHAEEIIRLVQDLSPSLRTVFNLNVIEGYSHKEIAEMLEISESTSRTNLLRARKMLQSKIDKHYLKKNRSA